ncbi:CaiB/BaiF CoA transferase family protein [Lichenihabitans psoromatis]|uniref:CaiB/BaiF CoA transferase family protein n=1 Tax=Lichenihabitans psoromatis TaxID=2528642 RepID=UPI0010383DA7|nr:CaiB/BaiF CoA-transferase family protein [Lichenihabitans psoromatis]
MPRLLDGLLVLDMAQFLSGPSAALRLGDLGARVIKVERPRTGDICRTLYLTDTELGGDSTLFHAINRNKESFAADLKNGADRAAVKALIARADVLIQNFRPGVIERLGFGYEHVRALNPRLVYAGISGYGEEGPWMDLPGQDLLAQAVSGGMWLSGSEGHGPVPFGLSIADMLAGHALVEGILAALVRRGITGEGAHVQTSLLEAMLDLQFEVLTTYLNDGGRAPARSSLNNAHAYLAAPYGVYATRDGYLALAMTPLPKLAALLRSEELETLSQPPEAGFDKRDQIKRVIADQLVQDTTEQWLHVLRAEDVWCAPVLSWPDLLGQEAFRRLDMLQTVRRVDGTSLQTTRSPIRVDGHRPKFESAAPKVGEHTNALIDEFGLR